MYTKNQSSTILDLEVEYELVPNKPRQCDCWLENKKCYCEK